MSEEFDTEYTKNIVCPYCGYENRDSWDINFGSHECVDVDCDSCGKEMHVYRQIEVTYSSEKKP